MTAAFLLLYSSTVMGRRYKNYSTVNFTGTLPLIARE